MQEIVNLVIPENKLTLVLFLDTDYCETHRCHKDAICINLATRAMCQCKSGFHGNGYSCSGKIPDLLLYKIVDNKLHFSLISI